MLNTLCSAQCGTAFHSGSRRSILFTIAHICFTFTMLSIIFICFAVIHTVNSSFSDIDFDGFTTGSVGYKLFGASANARLGAGTRPAGDFNGDGVDDMILGSYILNRCYVVFGRTGNTESSVDMATFVSSESTGIIFLSDTSGASFGEFVDYAGDVNGDGYDDIVISAYLAPYSGRTSAGRVYIIFGRPNSLV